jgi:sulfur-oxidizing protein SoxY
MRRLALATALATIFVLPAAATPEDDAARAQRWHDLAQTIFDGRQPIDQPGWVSIDAPVRAMDAALVPVTLTLAPGKPIRAIYLVVDENPSPIAAHIVLGPAADARTITLRIRVDQYTNLHAVAETTDGRLIATARFVKAAGGCSAPGAETPELALQGAGKMKLRVHETAPGAADAELLIRHPNFNGMQMDQVTRLYTPARYINRIDIAYNGTRVLHLDTDISLAADPAIGFGFKSAAPGQLSVDVGDTAHATWHQDFAVPQHGT